MGLFLFCNFLFCSFHCCVRFSLVVLAIRLVLSFQFDTHTHTHTHTQSSTWYSNKGIKVLTVRKRLNVIPRAFASLIGSRDCLLDFGVRRGRAVPGVRSDWPMAEFDLLPTAGVIASMVLSRSDKAKVHALSVRHASLWLSVGQKQTEDVEEQKILPKKNSSHHEIARVGMTLSEWWQVSRISNYKRKKSLQSYCKQEHWHHHCPAIGRKIGKAGRIGHVPCAPSDVSDFAGLADNNRSSSLYEITTM